MTSPQHKQTHITQPRHFLGAPRKWPRHYKATQRLPRHWSLNHKKARRKKPHRPRRVITLRYKDRLAPTQGNDSSNMFVQTCTAQVGIMQWLSGKVLFASHIPQRPNRQGPKDENRRRQNERPKKSTSPQEHPAYLHLWRCCCLPSFTRA